MNVIVAKTIFGNTAIARILCATALLLIGVAGVCQEHPRISDTERGALVSLFQSTHGDSWKRTDGWITETGQMGDPGTECASEGVDCDSAKAHVVNLSLRDCGLQGIIPANIS